MARANPEFENLPMMIRTKWSNGVPYETLGFDMYATYGLRAYSRDFVSSVTSNYRMIPRRGKKFLAPLPHVVNGCRVTSLSAFYDQNRIRADGYVINETRYTSSLFKLSSMPVITNTKFERHYSAAFNKARAKAASQLNAIKANLLQAFGERRQTASLLADAATRVYMAARCVRRADLEGFINATGLSRGQGLVRDFTRVRETPLRLRLSKHWLELQYGWKPLLQDVYGAAELLASHIANERFQTSVRGQGSQSDTVVTAVAYPQPEVIRKTSCRVKLGFQFSLENEARARLSQTGIDNPALLAWELLPWSFVVDWFLPVGNYIEALTAFSGFVFVSGWESRKTTEDVLVTYRGRSGLAWDGSQYSYSALSGSYATSCWKYERLVHYTLPGALPPSFKNPIGGEPLNRLLTATALLAQLFGR